LAGPVVAAAVILPESFKHAVLTDSKKLTVQTRERLYEELTGDPRILWALAVVESEEIDRLNILRATHEAMRRAVAALRSPPNHVLIDGRPVRPFPIAQTALVGGDGLSFSIAAASVIAKVTRDRLMVAMDARHPGYDFARHKGYGTALHLAKLRAHGPCPIHRRSFLPVRQAFP
jgi:ribonuclease HII